MNVYLGANEIDPSTLGSLNLEGIYRGGNEVWSATNEIPLAYYGGVGSPYGLFWDGKDSIGFKFSYVGIWDSSTSSMKLYSGEIWMSDTDYGMPTLKQMGITPNIIPSASDLERLMLNGGNNLFFPGVTTVQNTYSNGSWAGTVNLNTYDGVPSQDWANAGFVGFTEWSIICAMFERLNMWETPEGETLDYTGGCIPGLYLPNGQFYGVGTIRYGSITIEQTKELYYIPGDYYSIKDSYGYLAPLFRTDYGIGLSRDMATARFDIQGESYKHLSFGKMRVLNTTKTNYSLES